MDVAPSTPVGPVLLDNTVLSNFALAGRADLVLRLWPRACTTAEAMDEFRAAAVAGLVSTSSWSGLLVIALTTEEAAFAVELPPRLGTGERACLATAVFRRALLATDDRDARSAARRHGVPTSGTVGILVACVQRGWLTLAQGDALLADMIEMGYHSPVVSLEEILGKP